MFGPPPHLLIISYHGRGPNVLVQNSPSLNPTRKGNPSPSGVEMSLSYPLPPYTIQSACRIHMILLITKSPRKIPHAPHAPVTFQVPEGVHTATGAPSVLLEQFPRQTAPSKAGRVQSAKVPFVITGAWLQTAAARGERDTRKSFSHGIS